MAPRIRTPRNSVLQLICAIALLGAMSQAMGFELKTEVARCEGCHGPSGRAVVLQNNGRIAGQNEAYLFYILREYRAGRLAGVNADVMTYAVKQLNDDDLRVLAHYYARLQ